MIKKIRAYVLWSKDHLDNDVFRLSFCEMDSCGYVTVTEQEFNVVIPDDFDPRKKQVEFLRKEKERIGAEFAKRCTQIDEQINKLTALEYT